MNNREQVSLPKAAMLLRKSWREAWDMVLRGELPAEQTKSGRWLVQMSDIATAKQKLGLS